MVKMVKNVTTDNDGSEATPTTNTSPWIKVKKTKTVQTIGINGAVNGSTTTDNTTPTWFTTVAHDLNTRFDDLEQKLLRISQLIETELNHQNLQKPDTLNFEAYLKDMNHKIDTLAKKMVKLEQKTEVNELNIKYLKDLPDIKKELRIQQKILKSLKKD